MSKYLLQFYASLLLSVAYVTAEVTVEKGGYSLLVSFAQNVVFEDGKTLMDNVTESLQMASEVLHSAIGLQFSKVTFQIPYSWDTSEWNITVLNSYDHERKKADILIDNTNDFVFGKFPFTQQYGSCGTPGHRIIIPSAFFHEDNEFPKGISLAREWLKYRYGVFDENGYPDDPLYPSFYTTPGRDQNEVQITDCVNTELPYKFVESNGDTNCSTQDKTLIERLKNGECEVLPDENSLENVTSSLMYYEKKISNMKHICGRDDNEHNSLSPSKQNTLCFGNSIWETVKDSRDLKNAGTNNDLTDIEYVYIQESKPKVIVAWENTKNIAEKGKIMLNAVTKFMIDLPDGSKFSAFPFTSSGALNKEYSLTELDDKSKKTVIHDISSEFNREENGNINNAINKAIEILQSSGTDDDAELEGDIIIITGNVVDNFDSSKIVGLKKVCVRILFLLGDGTLPDEVKEDMSKLPCATVNEFLKSDDDVTLFEKLYESMAIILPGTTDDKETKTVTQYLNEDSKIIKYEADDFIETVTFWIFDKKDFGDFNVSLNGHEESDRKKVETFTTIGFISYTIQEPGSIGLEYPYPIDQPMLVQVIATSKEGKYFSGEVIVHNPPLDDSKTQMPVVIYAIVRFGPYPLQKAKVSAIIEDPMGNTNELDLYDDGRGDPDITQYDGIYSRYFTNFTGPGDYTVTVHVENDGNLTTYGKDDKTGYQTCCGSFVREGSSTELSDFSRTYHGTFTSASGRPSEGYKPSRITDLRIAEVTDDKIILEWSAPGGEADSGTASRYEINTFCERENSENNSTSCNASEMMGILNKPTPLNYGREQRVTVHILERTHRLKISITSVNQKNKTSDPSNIIQIFEPSEAEEPTTDPVTIITRASQVGIIVGCVLIGILILMCIIIAINYYRKRKLQNTDDDGTEEVKVNYIDIKSNFNDHPRKHVHMKRVESFPVLLYTHDQIKDYRVKDKGSPLYKANIPPKEWKSLDVVSSSRKTSDSDTRSASSSSTMNPKDDS